MRNAAARLMLLLFALCTGCSSGPPAPAGWQPLPGGSPNSAWETGSGPTLQTYAYARYPFTGTLQDLASQRAVDVVLKTRGTRFLKSDTFAACPGTAAVATFDAGRGRVLLQGFAVQNGQAVVVTYTHPQALPMGSDVGGAMEKALCVVAL